VVWEGNNLGITLTNQLWHSDMTWMTNSNTVSFYEDDGLFSQDLSFGWSVSNGMLLLKQLSVDAYWEFRVF
jgi:hypothetical protein